MGRYEGEPIVRFLDDGRRIQLRECLAYIDDAGDRWDVPADAIVDGASIPQILWSIIGGPFEGVYRNASIIHDWYCDLRSRPWLKVHRMFHEAMISSGVGSGLAKLLYAGVYMGGPRWTETVVANVSLLADEYLKRSGPQGRQLHYPMPIDEYGSPIRKGPYANTGYTKKTRVYHYGVSQADMGCLQELASTVETLENMDLHLDAYTRDRKQITTRETEEKLP